MKIKFSKVMAIGCALCVAFAGLTAFAADVPTVVTTTNYDFDAEGGTEGVTVVTTVNNAEPNSEVTYYVSKKVEGEDKDEIVYINQDTVKENGTVGFTFNASYANVLAATAKYGTDDSELAGQLAGWSFAFNQGTNYITSGTANVEGVSVATLSEGDYTQAETVKKMIAVKAKVGGNYTEYGIKVGEKRYPAAGCDQSGNYIVILENIVDNVSDVSAYAVKLDGTLAEVAVPVPAE